MLNIRNVLSSGEGTNQIGRGTPWMNAWKGPHTIIYGHDAVRGLQIHRDQYTQQLLTLGLDTGAVYGNALTAYVYPSCQLVNQTSHAIYSPPSLDIHVKASPFEPFLC